jgi:hypothetical protein
VINNIGGFDQIVRQAKLAQWLPLELLLPATTPSSVVVRSASIVFRIVPQHALDAGAGRGLVQDRERNSSGTEAADGVEAKTQATKTPSRCRSKG